MSVERAAHVAVEPQKSISAFRERLSGIEGTVSRVLPRILPVDVLTMVFLLAMMSLIVVFRGHIAHWIWQATFYGLVGAWVALLVGAAWTGNPVLRFLRVWYPLLLCVLFFENVGNLVHMVYPGWLDRIPMTIDLAVLGVHPTVWVQQFARPWLNDLMQAGYTAYFFLSPALGVWLTLAKRDRAWEEALFGTTLTYYGCYLFFVLFPVEGPHHTLFGQHTVELTGGWPTTLINWVESFARVHGGAFPSAHVAGSTAVLYYSYRFERRLFWILLPVVLLLYASTVYGRYHYFVDVWAGWLTTALGVSLANRLFPAMKTWLSGRRHCE